MEKIVCGDVVLYRAVCPECSEYNLSGKRTFKCACGKGYDESTAGRVRYIATRPKRKVLRKYAKPLAMMQNNCCYWCYIKFGSLILKKDRHRGYEQKEIKIHVDHIIPYSYVGNSDPDNLCAACSICNAWKYNKHFKGEYETQQYLKSKWDAALAKGHIEFL